MQATPLSRRSFIGRSTLAAGALTFPFISSRNVLGANSRLNIAGIGAGGKGATDVSRCASQNIVALVDVDEARAAETFTRFSNAKRYKDYRVMFDEMSDQIDAITVSTPDHMHFHPAMRAIKEGKHLFCQKPLTHTVWEARELAKAAKKAGVATQMGNQGISNQAMRRDAEIIRAGAIGTIREIHCWTDRPGGWWKQGIRRPAGNVPVPSTLDWDLWLGCAPWRPYNPAYVPFAWRGFWDFGTGAIGDMGCHLLNLPTLALDHLRDPSKITAFGLGQTSETGPNSSHIMWEFPEHESQAAFKLHWYDGGVKAPAGLFSGQTFGGNGIILVGDKDTFYAPNIEGGGFFRSGRTYDAFKDAPELFPKCDSWDQCHYDDWFTACQGGAKALSNFDKAGPVTEIVLLGQAAMRAGKPLEWDATNLQVTNEPTANQYIRTQYRDGWEV